MAFRKSGFILCLIIALSFFQACALNQGSEGTPLAKTTVLSVTNSYISTIVAGKIGPLEGMVLWAAYIPASGNNVNKEVFYKQVQEMKTKWKVQDHPLLGLEVLGVDVKGNDAQVRLKSKKRPEAAEILIELTWTGHGWLVSKDSIFGHQGYVADAMQQS